MSYEVHLLSKTYFEEKDLATNIQKAAEKLHYNFRNASEDNFIQYNVSTWDPEILEKCHTLEIFINTKEKFDYSIKEDLYPNITNYGANIFIGYAYGTKDEILIPFLRAFLKVYTDMLVYVGENLPNDVKYYVYTKNDIDSFTTTNEGAFIKHPPINKDPIFTCLKR